MEVVVSTLPDSCVVHFATEPNGQPVADCGAASAAQRRRLRRLRCHWRHEQISVRMVVAAAARHCTDRTKAAVDAAGIDRIEDQIVDDHMPHVVKDTLRHRRGADCPCASGPVSGRGRGADWGF